MARPPRLVPQTVFADAYRVLEILGQGSMGSVYTAERIADGARVALKVVDVRDGDDPRAARRFEREVQAGLSIASEHVARVIEAGTDEARGIAWVAMEIAEGLELSEFVRERAPLPGPLARELMRQLFDAVSAAHQAGMIHRDLKPENIRVAERDDRPLLKVLDFGIAKSFEGLDVSGTEPGLGTPLWTAPEQVRDGYVPSPDADVWALGLLSFFVLTGKLYWRNAQNSASLVDLALEVLKAPIDPAGERAAELGVKALLPPGYEVWFSRAVNRDPAQRFRNATEAARDFDALFGDAGSNAPERGRGRPVQRTGLLLLVLIATCASMGYAIYALVASARH